MIWIPSKYEFVNPHKYVLMELQWIQIEDLVGNTIHTLMQKIQEGEKQ